MCALFYTFFGYKYSRWLLLEILIFLLAYAQVTVILDTKTVTVKTLEEKVGSLAPVFFQSLVRFTYDMIYIKDTGVTNWYNCVKLEWQFISLEGLFPVRRGDGGGGWGLICNRCSVRLGLELYKLHFNAW